MNTCGAEVLVANLKAQGVKHVFGEPVKLPRNRSCRT